MTKTTTILRVNENGKLLAYSFADIMHYHGFGYPGGVTHAFKAMELALPLLDNGNPPERREIIIETPFRGPGGRDAFEMVTRCVTEGNFTVDAGLMKPERGEVLKGYVFNFLYRGTRVNLQIREGHVREDFIALGRKPDRTAEEEAHLADLKQEMTDRLMVLPANEIYEVV